MILKIKIDIKLINSNKYKCLLDKFNGNNYNTASMSNLHSGIFIRTNSFSGYYWTTYKVKNKYKKKLNTQPIIVKRLEFRHGILLEWHVLFKGGIKMAVREGTVPVALGTVVTGVGAVMVSMEMMPMIAAGVVGFGAAHILLGAIDLVSNKNDNRTPSRA